MAPIYLSELRAELSEVGTPVSCTTQHYDPGQFSIHELLIQSWESKGLDLDTFTNQR